MSYEQHIRHFRNHRKDRYFQQCSGYFGFGQPEKLEEKEDLHEKNSRESMEVLLQAEHSFPIYVAQNTIGEWVLVPKNHIAGECIADRKSLEVFASDYAGT